MKKTALWMSIMCMMMFLGGCGSLMDEDEKSIAEVFAKKTTVFGVNIYATASVSDETLTHVSNVMAKYLDSNDDGTPNSQAVVDKLAEQNVGLGLLENESEAESVFGELGANGDGLQELYESEVVLTNGDDGRFDFSLEEVLHLITQMGYSKVFNELKEERGSDLANAMDTARGGFFETVPAEYPAGAWYTYIDETCDYRCMITEYFYWGLTSKLGGQNFEGRLASISDEWDLNTAALIQATDTALHTILNNAAFQLPTVLPDGQYRTTTFEITQL